MNADQLLRRLDKAWIAFKDSYAGLSEPEVLEPGVTKTWSVRDIIAHVTTWEEEALKHLPAILEGRRPPRYSVMYGGIDAFNALTTAKKADLTLAEVYRQQEEVHRQVIDAIVWTPEAQLARDTRYRHRLRLDTYNHYPKHTEAIRQWRAQRQAIPAFSVVPEWHRD
jgi:CHAD domain-containing protein